MRSDRVFVGNKKVLLISASAFALCFASVAVAQEEHEVDQIIVTGTRIASSINATSPTPVTAVETAQLQETAPGNIPDGLNKLPVFQGSNQPRTPGSGNGSSPGAQNVLSLRAFGAQRTLLLIDGKRVAPSNANGTVSADTIPQMLVQRVDVTTGGASAVYGSDAVTGVVNFILDKNFTGLKFEANAGISKYGDGESGRVGVAAGAPVLGGRGHVLGSVRYRQQGLVSNLDRPYGDDVYVRTGNGSVNSPYTVTRNARRADSTYGGLVQGCVAPCPANGQQFVADGILGPYYPGLRTGTSGVNAGGDGAFAMYSTAIVKSVNDEAFGRFSYELTDTINFYVQAQYAEMRTRGNHFPAKLTPGNGQASTFFKNNAFLPAATRAALGDNGSANSSNTFQLGTYIVSQGPEGFAGVKAQNIYRQFQTGLDGRLGDYRWDLYYTHGRARNKILSLNNSDYQKQFAALDAVAGPNGTVQCYAATQAATAAAYAGCVPLNAFGPDSITPGAYDWFTDTTHWGISNTMDNVGASLSGALFEGWAGPVDFAVSSEARWSKYEVRSSSDPLETVDCTGLRICNPNLPRWAQPVSGEVSASSNVWEVAGELLVPLAKDLPFVSSLNANLAGRYTDYSTSGSVQTWKVGLDWALNDLVRVRGTVSRDIRAPTLDDLYRPQAGSVGLFNDVHTGIQATLFNYSQGNPNLVPEVARTYTAGVVFTPSGYLPGFNASLDFYNIRMDNAIGNIAAGNTAIQQICESTNGASEYCNLYDRPLPFSDRSPANFPTRVYTLGLNTALTEIEGWDIEANYRFEALGGRWTTRVLGNYQPVNRSQGFLAGPYTYVAAAKGRITSLVRYEAGAWAVTAQDRWLSDYSLVAASGQQFRSPDVKAYHTVDLNVNWTTDVGGAATVFSFTVENAMNKLPPIIGNNNVGGGLPGPDGYDVMGRYFTVGVRSQF